MQVDVQTNEQLITVIHGAENVAIIPSKTSGVESFCAAVAMQLMLKAIDKNCKILYPGSIPDTCKDLITDADVITSFNQRQLTVSIDYSGEHGAKAWYEPQGQTLKVKLAPVSKDFDLSTRVRAKLDIGIDFDTAIILGANELADLGEVYKEIQSDLVKSTIINLSNSSRNTRFGSVNIIDPTCETVSQLIVKKSPLWDFNITTAAARALLLGITTQS